MHVGAPFRWHRALTIFREPYLLPAGCAFFKRLLLPTSLLLVSAA